MGSPKCVYHLFEGLHNITGSLIDAGVVANRFQLPIGLNIRCCIIEIIHSGLLFAVLQTDENIGVVNQKLVQGLVTVGPPVGFRQGTGLEGLELFGIFLSMGIQSHWVLSHLNYGRTIWYIMVEVNQKKMKNRRMGAFRMVLPMASAVVFLNKFTKHFMIHRIIMPIFFLT